MLAFVRKASDTETDRNSCEAEAGHMYTSQSVKDAPVSYCKFT